MDRWIDGFIPDGFSIALHSSARELAINYQQQHLHTENNNISSSFSSFSSSIGSNGKVTSRKWVNERRV